MTSARPPQRRLAGLFAAGAVLALQACVVVPQTRETYDPNCRVMRKEVRLETTIVGRLQACQGDACVAVLVATGVVTAATAVVSGSFAVIGNVAFWFERQGQCNAANPSATPAAAAPG